MSSITFEWNAAKASINRRKHGISFDEAKTVFFDENARLIHDPDHSDDEDRFVMIGISAATRILVVIHCYQKEEGVIRIISARRATKTESAQYHGGVI